MEIKQHTPEHTPGSRKKSKGKIKSIMRQTKMGIQHTKLTGCSKSSFKRKVYSDERLHQEKRKI